MKKLADLFIVSLVICSAILIMPMKTQAAQDSNEEKEDTIFQKMSDVINGKYEVKTVPFKKIGIFQKMADGIGNISRQ